MKKILLVDNNYVILKFMSNFLEKKGCHVLTAEDGLAALEILRIYTPDIILLDLIMPNIDGKKLCRIVRAIPRLKDVYVVILSAIVAEDQTEFTEFGADACIAKGPFDVMSRNVSDVVDQWEKGDARLSHKEIMGIEGLHRRNITKELLSSQKHFETILGAMSEGIVELTQEAKIVYVNPVAVSLLGEAEETLLASDFTELFDEKDHRKIQRLFDASEQMSQTVSEGSSFSLNGKLFSIKILPVKENGNEANIVILNDVSRQKTIETQLRHAQKMEAIGTLAGGIAHDFNNLLMGVQGHASLMLLDVDVKNLYAKHLREIEDLVQRGSDLTKQLLAFARDGKIDAKPTNLNEVVKKCTHMFGRTRKEITIRESYAKDLWSAVVDRGQIEQVLLNLFVNAWQAMPGGGEISLQTENAVLSEGHVKPFKVEAGSYVKICIGDTGTGMDERTKERLFEPFFTTKEIGRGTGLGLASVYGIIKNHGGFINVHSERGKGSTFTVYVPSSDEDAIKEKRDSTEIIKGSETILLVDDEKVILDVSLEILERIGYKVIVAGSGTEALEIYEANKDEIDMVIMDMIMPGMGGSETYKKIKKINPRVKVLLSSGYSIDGQAEQILNLGCNGFIQKPFRMEALSRTIRDILEARGLSEN